MRRDNPKYLNLILAVTFSVPDAAAGQARRGLGRLHRNHAGRHRHCQRTGHRTLWPIALDELSRPGRGVAAADVRLRDRARRRSQKAAPGAKITFSRRELREAFKWSEYQLRTHLDELAELEYVWPLSGRQGQPFRYRLLYDGRGRRAATAFYARPQIRGAVAPGRRGKLRFGLGKSRVQTPPASRAKIEPLRGRKNRLRGYFVDPFQRSQTRIPSSKIRGFSQWAGNFEGFAGEPCPGEWNRKEPAECITNHCKDCWPSSWRRSACAVYPFPPSRRESGRWTSSSVIWSNAGIEDIRAVTRRHIRDYQEAIMLGGKYTRGHRCISTLISLRRLFEHLEAATRPSSIRASDCACPSCPTVCTPECADALEKSGQAVLKQSRQHSQTPQGHPRPGTSWKCFTRRASAPRKWPR